MLGPTAGKASGCPTRHRVPTLGLVGGVVVTCGAWLVLDLLYACVAALATLTWAASSPSVIGTAPIPQGASPDRAAVRRWRAEHPSSTVSEAIAAVTKS
ncbi:hypothetical protein EDF25_3608 [Curtobacterium sp. PhB131]|nr:hypothetical protein EDF40_3680 [Curtobacterium sp. PhB170]ROS32574.1 hypothetical protein EDF25_3608 [Curtobacterium sp. PhB131]ROS63658.1 hypothetical protein EDF30_3734 [Curtobacterium sp. PhB141]